ncbi:MAG: tryptophanase, partial [Candidatus Kapabacteria bacterium]|nr:tryptophanase [Candidatus Kapabacteria bacterium]MDW7997683.1 tryptophanase [Bacteroidota bacterium]
MPVLFEPFRIKVVEPIRLTTRAERESLLQQAHYNVFRLRSADVLIDLLTDSGTAAMSDRQWAAMFHGDEAYAGSHSYYRFIETVGALTGMPYIFPVHQGRAAEHILFHLLGGPGKIIPSNTHFDTTRANIEQTGAEALDLPIAEALLPESQCPFKGNLDVAKLEELIEKVGADRIPVCLFTLTNNTLGGHPASLANIRAVKKVLSRYGIPLFLDACRIAENAYCIKLREPGYVNRTPWEIAQEIFSHADGCFMSAKKDGLANIGGFLAVRDVTLVERIQHLLILWEGFPTYGGLAGRDLEAIAQGLHEAFQEEYLHHRIHFVAHFAEQLRRTGVPIIEPPGGHAVFIDAARFAPHIAPEHFPGQAIVCALYVNAGVRAVEV